MQDTIALATPVRTPDSLRSHAPALEPSTRPAFDRPVPDDPTFPVESGSTHDTASTADTDTPDGGLPRQGWSGLEHAFGPLDRWLRKHCRDVNLQADVLQDTLIRAARFQRPEGRSLQRAWILRVAHNVLRDHLRKRQRGPVVGLDDACLEGLLCRESRSEPESGDERFRVGAYDLDVDQARDRLGLALERLADEDRALLVAWYACGGRSLATSEATGVPRRLIKTRVYRARRRLRSALRHVVAVAWRP